MNTSILNTPVFVLGAQRSGTTVFRLMLNAHSRLAIPPESHFIRDLIIKLPLTERLSESQLQTAIELIINEPHFLDWKLDNHKIRNVLANLSEPCLRNVIDTVFALRLEKENKPRWGDKTPEYVEIAEELNILYPDARIIHLVRDGRDVVNSLGAKGWQGVTIWQRSLYWNRVVKKMSGLQSNRPPDSFLEIHYEDLILKPEITIRCVCEFIGEKYEANMLKFYEDASAEITKTEKKLGIHSSITRAPRKADIGKWRKQNGRLTTLLGELFMSKSLRAHGYELSTIQIARCLTALILPVYAVYIISVNIARFIFNRVFPAAWSEKFRRIDLVQNMIKIVKGI